MNALDTRAKSLPSLELFSLGGLSRRYGTCVESASSAVHWGSKEESQLSARASARSLAPLYAWSKHTCDDHEQFFLRPRVCSLQSTLGCLTSVLLLLELVVEVADLVVPLVHRVLDVRFLDGRELALAQQAAAAHPHVRHTSAFNESG